MCTALYAMERAAFVVEGLLAFLRDALLSSAQCLEVRHRLRRLFFVQVNHLPVSVRIIDDVQSLPMSCFPAGSLLLGLFESADSQR